MAHNHEHEHEVITLVNEHGNETLFEILLTIDGREEFGKNYVLLVPAGAEEMSKVKLKSKLILSLKMKMEQKATFNQSLKTLTLSGI